MLTHNSLKKLVPRAKLYRLADAKGLRIEVRPNGSERWRFRYRFTGKAKMLSLGE